MLAVFTAVSDISNFSCMWHCMDKIYIEQQTPGDPVTLIKEKHVKCYS